jgi:hypothetical protein
VSRYAWPDAGAAQAAEGKDDAGGRAGYNARRRSGSADALARALLREAATATPRARAAGRARPRGFPPTDTLLWQPLGPSVLLGGQAEGAPRVTGRVNAICVHPGGLRAYAASANGGVWATTDGGKRWQSVAGLASTNIADVKRPAHRNVSAALHVLWRDPPAGNELVFMGTGEPHPMREGRPGHGEDGLGIFVADKPLTAAALDPWQREAKHLVNDVVYGFASSPDGSVVVAATASGLYQRPPDPVAADAPWTPVPGMPTPANGKVCTSVLWTAGDPASVTPANQRRPERLWVWISDGTNNGLWVRDATNLAAGFVSVPVDAANSAFGFVPERGVLAAAVALPAFVWLLQDLGGGATGLFRIANTKAAEGAPKALAVENVPDIFHGTGWYNVALAVDPGNENRVAVAGNFYGTPSIAADADILTTVDGATRSYDAAILLDTVVPKTGSPARLVYGALPRASQMIGVGVHPDVHALAFSNGGASLWTGCDGGVYRNDRPGTSVAGFYAVNEGLSISETNFLGASVVHEGDLMVGLQDNGVGARVSGSVWRVVILADGGGIVREPTRPERWIAQYTNGTWSTPAGYSTGGPLAWAATVATSRLNSTENDAAAFYTLPSSIGHTRGATKIGQFLIGTTRPWYTDDNGTTWCTLPTATDARSVVGGVVTWNNAQDDLGSKIYACRWQDPDTAWVLTGNAVWQLTRTPGSHAAGGPGTWTKPALKVLDKNAPASTDEGKAKKRTPPDPNAPLALLRSSPHWLEIEPNFVPAAGAVPARAALYLGTIGHPTVANVDTLWWYDGSTWMSTELLTRGYNGTPLPAPVTAILVDPALPDEVWVGTSVGVVHGKRSAVASPPAGGRTFKWDWTMHLNGLPEAPVEDLVLYKDGTLRLLRAAIGARGVWELRLDQEVVPALTYLRVHEGDLRHRPSARLLQGDGTTERPWHASPDIRPRLAPSTTLTGPTTAAPWTRLTPPDKVRLQRFQAALRSSTGDVRIVANGLWDGYFSEVLRERGAPSTPVVPAPPAPLLPQSTVRIDPAYFAAHFKSNHRLAEPWGAGPPTLADLIELTPPIEEGAATEAACKLAAKPWKVEVVVHHRGRAARPGADVRVTLLWFMDPTVKNRMAFNEPARWAAIPGDWTAPVQTVLNRADGIGSSAALPSGWHYALGTNTTSRHLGIGGSIDPLNAGIASFDLNLAGLPKDRLVLLVAVLRAGADIVLPNLPLRQLVLEQPAVAVRAVRIA